MDAAANRFIPNSEVGMGSTHTFATVFRALVVGFVLPLTGVNPATEIDAREVGLSRSFPFLRLRLGV
jgi:hypothetical protein